jgi:hypothetical protein
VTVHAPSHATLQEPDWLQWIDEPSPAPTLQRLAPLQSYWQCCPHCTLHVSPAVHCASQLSRQAMLQLVTLVHVARHPGLAPHCTSQLPPPLQLQDDPLHTQLAPAQVGNA